MKEKIERFSKGDFEYELPFLCLSEEKLLINIEAGKIFEGSFTIGNSANRRMKGVLYASDRLLTFEDASFEGTENNINYQFNAVNRNEGESIKGEISIISDCGELSLPFQAEIVAPYCETSIGSIKDLEQFTNLARMDWTEAKRIFRSEEFERVLIQNEEKYKIIYRNLLKSISTSQALEEFLIAINKKSVIHLSIDRTNVNYLISEVELRDKLTLTKDNWGYAEIRVSTEAPFIQLDQKFLWSDRFIGNMNQIWFTIEPKALRPGKNHGQIYIKTVHQTLTVDVECSYRREAAQTDGAESNVKQYPYHLMENYLKFRLNRINLAEYLDETKVLLNQMLNYTDQTVRDLISLHLAIISGKENIALELLEEFAGEESILKRKSVFEYCAYLYLKALYYKDKDRIKDASDTIREYYDSEDGDWRLLWFLLYTDKHYEKNKGDKLAAIREQFEAGCHSPILYYEAVCIFNEEPYLLRELNDFEIQALNFGIKNVVLSKDVALQYTYLANRRKSFHQVVFHGLEKLYEEFGIAETLSAICCMLIKGLKRSSKYFEWFRLGVEAQLRITELYEYYMYSVSDSKVDAIATPVLLYFIYNSSLNDRKKAFLYANVIKHKDELESIYRSYYKKMEVFAATMLEAHYINRDLAVLYREFIDRKSLGQEPSKHLPYVMYRQDFTCDNPNIAGISVVHPISGEEDNIQLSEGKAQVSIYSEDALIFLIDANGNRYVTSVEYELKPLMPPEEYEEICFEQCRHPMLLLHLYERYQKNGILHDKSYEVRKQVLELEGLKEESYMECLQTLIDHYNEVSDPDLLNHYLELINLSKLPKGNRIHLLELMMARVSYDKAAEALKTSGFEGVSLNRLVSFCTAWIADAGFDMKNSFMVSLCNHVFTNGMYDEAILQYLVKYFNGPTREMFTLWKAAKGFELETHRLEERLLMQMLFAESHVGDSLLVFNEYYKDVTNHLLVRAFLSFYAYRYLVHDRIINNELFPIMRRELNYEENDVCLLAWLKNQASNRHLSENETIFIELSIGRLVKKGIALPFFLDYKNRIRLPESLADKYLIEYKTDPGKQVYIHYCLVKKEDEDEYISERLTNTFLGIHCKEFVLFYHETMQYYITEEIGEDVNVMESVRIECELGTTEEESKYNQINLMLLAKELKDESTLLDMIEYYIRADYMISKCFRPLE